MSRTLRTVITLVLTALAGALLAACSGATVSPTATATQPPTPTDEPSAMPTIAATAESAVPAPTADVNADILALRPAQPAAEDEDFRPDPVAVVAATGRPQLIEVFSYD